MVFAEGSDQQSRSQLGFLACSDSNPATQAYGLSKKMDIAIAVIGGLATAAALWKPIFGDMENFAECIGYWFTPDAWSFLNNEYWEDWWAELKLGIWILPSIGVGYGLYCLFQ